MTFSVKGVSGLSPWHMIAKNVSHAGQPRRAATPGPLFVRRWKPPPRVLPLGALFPHVEKDEDVVGTDTEHNEYG